MRITTSTRLSPGYYPCRGISPAVEIATDGVTLDLAGSVIDGGDFTSVGIHITTAPALRSETG